MTDSTHATSSGLGFAPIDTLPDISASDLKNQFSKVARLASRNPVAITRHHRREFVILTIEHYMELQHDHQAPLENLSAEFDQLVSRMNSPKGRQAAASLFTTDSKKLSRAAGKNPTRKTDA